MTTTDQHRQDAGHEEIERKFLLCGMPALPTDRPIEIWRIEQGYLDAAAAHDRDCPENLVAGRLRRVTYPDGTTGCFHTMKRGAGLVRHEVERSISAEQYAGAWPRTVGRRLRKTRHRVHESNGVWEIDEFDGIDLVLAEIELPHRDFDAKMPEWLVRHVERDVTDDPAYANAAIALRMGGAGHEADVRNDGSAMS